MLTTRSHALVKIQFLWNVENSLPLLLEEEMKVVVANCDEPAWAPVRSGNQLWMLIISLVHVFPSPPPLKARVVSFASVLQGQHFFSVLCCGIVSVLGRSLECWGDSVLGVDVYVFVFAYGLLFVSQLTFKHSKLPEELFSVVLKLGRLKRGLMKRLCSQW